MTPTPWSLHISKHKGIEAKTLTGAAKYYGDYFAVGSAGGDVICDNADYYAQPVEPENMKHIVKCVNAHDDLLAALRGFTDPFNGKDLDEIAKDYSEVTYRKVAAARAAISKATS